MNRRIYIATLTGAILGIFCIIGVGFRMGFSGNEIFLFSTWFNRLLMGLVIGIAGSTKMCQKYSPLLRGFFFGLVISFAHYASSEFIDLVGFIAGIFYGIIIDYFASKPKKALSKKKKRMPIYMIAIIIFLSLMLIWIAYGYFGSRVEKLGYTVIESNNEYEIRLLNDHIVAETEVSGGFSTATNSGFGIVAGYIFGDNKAQENVAMTSPVVTEKESEKIAMTTPVVTEEDPGEKQILYFVMPEKYTMDTLPEPNDSRVKLREVKGKKIAVIEFSGFYTNEKFEKKKNELKEYLERDEIEYGSLSSVGYNPPWTPPFMRRSEVWAEIID